MKKKTTNNQKNNNAMNKTMIKKNISDVRNSLNLTQAEMAEKIGISRQAYINLENGKTSPINKQISKMAEECGITEEKILFGHSHAEMEASQLREAEGLREKLQLIEQENNNKITELKDKLDVLTQLVFSERQHVKTQEMLINEQRSMITKLTHENSDLKQQLRRKR